MADNRNVSGETEAALASGGESRGSDYPNANEGTKPKQAGLQSHGGQSEMGYHGSGQLGDKKLGDGNQNAPARSADK